MTEITIPNSETVIGYGAFEGCSALVTIAPESVTSIGYKTFEGCNEVNIYTRQNVIVVEAAEAIKNEISVFDINGRLVAKEIATGARTEIAMPQQGLYIVRVGNNIRKVALQ